MNKINVEIRSSMNSDGLWFPSISIYFSGCDKPVKCKDCHNPELQQEGIGYSTDIIGLKRDIDIMLQNWFTTFEIMALCFIGGEPLTEKNRLATLEISKYFKSKYGNKVQNILYSWREIKDLENLKEYIEYIDYGVLGEFQIETLDLGYIPSSSNQYIYNFNTNRKISPIKKGLI